MRIQLRNISMKWYGLVAAILIVGIGWGVRDTWFPIVNEWVTSRLAQTDGDHREDEGEDHSGHDHASDDHGDHGHAHDESTSLELSEQAQRNIGLTVGEIKLQTYERTLNVPAMVVERPGRTRIQVATPMTGVVTQVHVIKGEAIRPGKLMFKIRLTHEDLVQAQTTFLQELGELDVEKQDIERLEKIDTGLIAPVIRERKYAKQKLEASLSAQREALLLHGLSESQVNQIETKRKLLRELQIYAPSPDDDAEEIRLSDVALRQVSASTLQEESFDPQPKESVPPYVIQDLKIYKGQSVQSGQTLCVLADLSELYIEGSAFEHDGNEVHAAARNEWEVTAVRQDNQQRPEMITGLKVVYVANEVDPSSRAMHFYVGLTNKIERNKKTADGHHFIDWKFKPGQRLRLRVSVEQWEDKIVLPVDAVAQEGVETYVFQQNGDHFDRVPVHVEYRDQFSVVIANDGSLFPGDAVALSGAHQMQVALKNKSGGAPDPHAGHNH